MKNVKEGGNPLLRGADAIATGVWPVPHHLSPPTRTFRSFPHLVTASRSHYSGLGPIPFAASPPAESNFCRLSDSRSQEEIFPNPLLRGADAIATGVWPVPHHLSPPTRTFASFPHLVTASRSHSSQEEIFPNPLLRGVARSAGVWPVPHHPHAPPPRSRSSPHLVTASRRDSRSQEEMFPNPRLRGHSDPPS
jgi:hypothetical protein